MYVYKRHVPVLIALDQVQKTEISCTEGLEANDIQQWVGPQYCHYRY